MDPIKKEQRYQRIVIQLRELFMKPGDLDSRLATITAILHHKMDYFFWTGFYLLKDGELLVKTYQGPLACQHLKKDAGVCWAGINRRETVIVPDVHHFPGHIACDSRSNSEIVVPLVSPNGDILGVFDADSKSLGAFDTTDAMWLGKILELAFETPHSPSE